MLYTRLIIFFAFYLENVYTLKYSF